MKNRVQNRILSVLLTAAVLLALVPAGALPVFAGGPEIWDGSVASGFASGTGTQTDPYIIKTGAQLAYLSQTVNAGTTYSGEYFKLGNDIVLNDTTNYAWIAIGTDSHPFSGTFDGVKYTVSGVYINTRTDYQGLFGFAKNAVIQNLEITESNIKAKHYISGVVGYNDSGTVKNCYNAGSVDNSNSFSNYIGGVVGYNTGTVENCYNTGSISGSEAIGGVVGYVDTGTVKNCYNTGSVKSTHGYAGGVVGSIDSSTIENCYSTGSVIAAGDYVGGVVGHIYDSTIENCYSTGSVDSMNIGKYVGGVIGFNYSCIVKNCYNAGSISGWAYVGGVVGGSNNTVEACYNTGTISGGANSVGGVVGGSSGTIRKCYSTSNVSGKYNVGGVVGYNDSGTVENCYNTGAVSGTDYRVGGVVGGSSGTIRKCYNTGAVSGTKDSVGGVVGFNYFGTVENCYYLTGCAKDGNNVAQYGIGSETKGQTSADVSGKTKGLTDAQMKKKENFVGFDFDKIWNINSKVNGGYPYLDLQASKFLKGDINGDGKVNAMDCLLLKGFILKTLKNATAEQIERMDLNGDKAINAVDYALLRAAVLGTKPL